VRRFSDGVSENPAILPRTRPDTHHRESNRSKQVNTITVKQTQKPPYQQTVDEILSALSVNARTGLSQEEAEVRLGHYGRNELTAEKPLPRWRKFLAQFKDILVILLLVATVVSAGPWFSERDSALPYEAMAIFAVVLLNAVMGYIQQSRAEEAVAALRKMSAAHASVLRDGIRQPRSCPATLSSSKKETMKMTDEIFPGENRGTREGTS